MTVQHVAIIPAAPLVLPDASPAQPAEVAEQVTELRTRVHDALQRLPAQGTALLLDAGPESLVHHADRASLAGYGLPQAEAPLRQDTELLSAVSARGQAPRVRSDRLDGDPAVLALLLAVQRPTLQVAAVTVPRGASAQGLADIAVGIRSAIDALDRPVTVVATGDLAATLTERSPGYLVDGAVSWDATAVAAVERGDRQAFADLGPQEARRVKAIAWAPIVVALELAGAADRSFAEVHYLAPRGVGQLVAG